MSIFLLFISFVVFSVADLPSCFSADQQYEKCRSGLTCGSGHKVFEKNTTYPFWGGSNNKPKFCGQSSFELSCDSNQNLTLAIGNLTLRVVSANLEDHKISVADDSLLDGGCLNIWNFNGKNQFTLDSNTEMIDVFVNCSGVAPLPSISCEGSYEDQVTYHVLRSSDSDEGCKKFAEIPMLRSAKDDLQRSILTFEEALKKGFDLRYIVEDKACRRCIDSGGICGSALDSESFRCFCADRPHDSSCTDNANQG